MSGNGQKLSDFRQRVFKMVSVGIVDDHINQGYDVISTLMLLINLFGAFAGTFDGIEAQYGEFLRQVEAVTVAFFALDYVLRMYTAPCLYPDQTGYQPYLRYAFSGAGIIDFLSFVPYYLPMFFPAGAVAFRLIRVARILRLFRINAYYDSLNVITDVIVGKSQQLLSSVFIIFVLMLASSLAMYSIEHEAQPGVFKNAFSGLWWAVSTLLTVGYGDIYPITPLGKAFGILITFLGVGMVAIPTGILSAGFVEQYTRVKSLSAYSEDNDIRFVRLEIPESHPWSGKPVSSLPLPPGLILAIIQRKSQVIVPHGDSQIIPGDNLILGAESFRDDANLNLKELTIRADHPWNGRFIKDLDIPRQSLIVMVRRDGKTLIPTGSLKLLDGDTILLYTKLRLALSEANTIEV